MKKRLTRIFWFSKCERGQALAMLAISATAFVAFSGLAVDLGKVYLDRARLRQMVDASAMAAVVHTPSLGQAISIAKSVAGMNYLGGSDLITSGNTEVGKWSSLTGFTPTPAASINQAVRITLTGKPVPLVFGPLVGIPTLNAAARAVAVVKSTPCGVIGGTGVKLQGTPLIDSYHSGAGPYAPGGDEAGVCSDGDITLGGNSHIAGDATPGPGHSVSGGGGGHVSGSTAPATQPLNLSPIDPGNAETTNNNTTGISPSNHYTYDSSTKDFNAGGTVTFTPGTYYFRNFTLGGKLTVTGATVIFVTGNFDMGGGIDNTTHLPSNLQIFLTSASPQTIDLKGNTAFYGVLYSFDANLTMVGTSDFYGAFVGKSVDLKGTSEIHVDEDILINGNTVRPIPILVQ